MFDYDDIKQILKQSEEEEYQKMKEDYLYPDRRDDEVHLTRAGEFVRDIFEAMDNNDW